MKYTEGFLNGLHTHCFNNAGDLEGKPAKCFCFYCKGKFMTADISKKNLLNETDSGVTICCPKCGMDSVLVVRKGSGLSDEMIDEVMDEMHEYFFEK